MAWGFLSYTTEDEEPEPTTGALAPYLATTTVEAAGILSSYSDFLTNSEKALSK